MTAAIFCTLMHMVKLWAGIAAIALALATAGTAGAANEPGLLPGCAYGASVPGLSGYEQVTVQHDAWAYADGLPGVSATQRTDDARTFAAAAAAYVYGLSLVEVHETVKRFEVRNVITSIDALETPANETTVSPNVDTAYSVGWIDLTSGPVVISVPNTDGRFYTIQLMDAYSNSFAYIGSGSTGTRAGSFALLPPGWSGSLPAGVTAIQSPTNTVWLLGRTLVNGTADLAAVKPTLEQIVATPLAGWELGLRGLANVEDSYPSSKPITTPTGTSFIATLNQELTIDPPPAGDDCAIAALAPAGVVLPHPNIARSLAADEENGVGDPTGSTAATPTNAAVASGTTDAVKLIAAASSTLNRSAARADHGWDVIDTWIGNYGGLYLGRAIVATGLLGANVPKQAIYPIDYEDIKGLELDGSRDYTLTFPRGRFPPVGAFWSLTMYDPQNYLYPNQINRYEVGNRTAGLVYDHDGSLTIRIQHAAPGTAAERANWLPAPAAGFHLILRLYQPQAPVFDGGWEIPPVVADGEIVVPVLSKLRITPQAFRPAAGGGVIGRHGRARVSYDDNQATLSVWKLYRRLAGRGDRYRLRLVATFRHRDRAGTDAFGLSGRAGGRALSAGRYVLKATAAGSDDLAPSRPAAVSFRVL
jgi:hypothetical protein